MEIAVVWSYNPFRLTDDGEWLVLMIFEGTIFTVMARIPLSSLEGLSVRKEKGDTNIVYALTETN